ncbi:MULTISPECIES: hypothetical protein [unclassified Streptomyces]|uniref:hypothetical protein n=1 Tax=unclassified Streptomyces TaxID=2593676 RepID=UPI000DC77F23|nr:MULTISPECIES: hypothetical protein [unclassified Streptomyces]AWZ05125.1 hypothetical protein DRB89_11195 [Streptomyces sp. ICC4]AWZ12618.1 hypothetical protein DRB96_10120 [Streptomyces sp. ICC1]
MTQSRKEPRTYQAMMEELPLRLEPDPDPVEGCAGCVELVAARDRAYTGGDWTTVTDCNIFIRRHPIGH